MPCINPLQIWRELETYFGEYLRLYYKLDADVAGDVELQAWWAEAKVRPVIFLPDQLFFSASPQHGTLLNHRGWSCSRPGSTPPWLAAARARLMSLTRFPFTPVQSEGHPDMKLLGLDEAEVWGFAGPIPNIDTLVGAQAGLGSGGGNVGCACT